MKFNEKETIVEQLAKTSRGFNNLIQAAAKLAIEAEFVARNSDNLIGLRVTSILDEGEMKTKIESIVEGEAVVNAEGKIVNPNRDLLCPECGHKFPFQYKEAILKCPKCGTFV